MKLFLCLIGFIGVLFVFHANESFPDYLASSDAKEISYFVSASNPPVSAVENTCSSAFGFIYDHSPYLQKRGGINTNAKYPFGMHSVELSPNNAYPFLNKSTSLFSLYHSAQSLLKIFLI